MNELDIFSAALELADPAARAHYLNDACSANPGLRTRIEALLRNAAEASQFLETPAASRQGATGTLVDALASDPPTTPQPSLDRTEMSLDADSLNLDFLTPSDDPSALGRIGQYTVTEVIGRGGMGIVLRASDPRLNRVVAVKVLAPELAGNATARLRFLREAQAAAAVAHQHVVTIHAVDEDRLPYLVMEYVDGVSLQEKIDRSGHLGLKETLRIGTQIASGLAAAHAHGVIHRDIKPSNILLENGVERVRITDFGLARAVDDAAVTKSGEVAGTPQYMSPEQAQGQTVDARSDLFNLGCVLYAMCTGRSPFRAETTVAAIRRVCDGSHRPIREINPEVPDWLVEVIDRLLLKDRDARIQTASEAADLLGRHLAHVQDPDSTPFPSITHGAKSRSGKIRSRFSRRVAVAGVLCAALAGLWVTEVTGVTHLFRSMLGNNALDGTSVLEGDRRPISGATGGEVRRINHGPDVVSVAISPDGKRALFGGTDSAVWFVDLNDSAKPRAFEGHTQTIRSVAFLPDGGRALSGSDDATVRLWDIASGQEVRRFTQHTEIVWCVAVSPDGRRAASGGGGRWNGGQFVPPTDTDVRLWDVETGEEIRLFRGEAAAEALGLAFSPDGRRLLVGSSNGVVRLWDVETGEHIRQYEGHRVHVYRVRFSRQGDRILTASADRTIRLWDTETGQVLGRFNGHTSDVTGIAFSPSGRYCASSSWDRTIRLWDVQSHAEVHRFEGHTGSIWEVAFSPSARSVLSGAEDGTVRLWQLPDELAQEGAAPPTGTGQSTQFTPAHTATERAEVHIFAGDPTSHVDSAAVSPDGRRVVSTGTVAGEVVCIVWNAATGRQERLLRGHTEGIHSVSIGPDSRRALTASNDGTMRLWDIETGAELQRFTSPGHVPSVAWSADGNRALFGTYEGTVILWDVKNWTELRRFDHGTGLWSVDYCPTPPLALTAGGELQGGVYVGVVRLWDLDTGTELRRFQGPPNGVWQAVFSPDGRQALSAEGSDIVRLWDVESGQEVRLFRGHVGEAYGVAFTADGRRALSAGADRTVRLWDVNSGKELHCFRGHTNVVRNVAASRDGQYALSGGFDGTARLWRLPPMEPIPATEEN